MDYRKIIGSMHKVDLVRKIYIRSKMRDSLMHRAQVPMLGFIVEHDGCTQSEAAEYLGVSSASVALSAKRMCAAGLIERRSDKQDARCNRLSATETGRKAFEESVEIFKELDGRTFAGFSEQELQSLQEMLGRMMNNIAEGSQERRMCELIRQLEEMEGKEKC